MLASLLFALACSVTCAQQAPNARNPQAAPPSPFPGLDTFATGDWWERSPNPILDCRVPRDQVLAFGMYTVQGGVLKLSAQLFPLYPDEPREVRLEFRDESDWVEVAKAPVNELGWSASFRFEDYDNTSDRRYRICHGEKATFEGRIRKDPKDKNPIVVAAFSCNSNHDRGMRSNYVRNVTAQDPDLLFFAGDQSYDHKEHTAAWLLFGLQFRELFRDRPCITIPDDHDVGQSNLWGENGKVAKLPGSSDGGYNHPAAYVQMVERCQTSHLPDPFDPAPIEQGIGVYFTHLELGGVDFAILEDRKFKSGPAGKLPKMGPRPDHIVDASFDPKAMDLDGLQLLGERQLAFLEAFAKPRTGVVMRAVLSQTGFCCAAHLHGTRDNRLVADLDSNGWPMRERNRALRLIQKASAVHIGGDQHLGSLVQHGIDGFGDGPWAFVVPALVNDYYGRWWWPKDESAGGHHDSANPLPWTGEYLDGFGNHLTMHAYANPESASGGAGYGVIRFDKEAYAVTFECWPRDVDGTAEGAAQFPGWPRRVVIGR